MSNHHNPIGLDAAIALYLSSKYFSELAPMTRSKRRGVLRNMRAEVQRLSAEISEAEISAAAVRNEIFSETLTGNAFPVASAAPARSAPRQPGHRRSWLTS
jgi:hypothetical protein